jgi:hypothetical protein
MEIVLNCSNWINLHVIVLAWGMAQAWTSGKDPCQLILSETPPLDETWQDCELRTRTSMTHKQTQQLDTEYRVPSCEPGCLSLISINISSIAAAPCIAMVNMVASVMTKIII